MPPALITVTVAQPALDRPAGHAPASPSGLPAAGPERVRRRQAIRGPHGARCRSKPSPTNHPPVVVSNVLARYSIKTTNTANVGSAVKTFEVAEYRKRALPETASLFARREMEGGDRLGIARCRRRKRISQCPNVLHRGAVSLYQDRSGGFPAERTRGESIGAKLVGHRDLPVGG